MMHFSLDLETLGQGPNATVISVGIVSFTKTSIVDEKDWHLNVDQQIIQGRCDEWETICWWTRQSEKAREIFNVKHRTSIGFFTGEFLQFCSKNDGDNAKVWSNGASFDIPIIESLLKRNLNTDVYLPWKFWNHRCYRTIKAITNCDKLVAFEGEKHGALNDARHQAKCLIELWKTQPEMEK